MTFSLTFLDDGAKIDREIWRSLLTWTLERTREGLVICDEEIRVVFCTVRSLELLQCAEGDRDVHTLPPAVARVVAKVLASSDDVEEERVSLDPELAPLAVHAARVVGSPHYVAVWLREDA
jgi:hypothetical protein